MQLAFFHVDRSYLIDLMVWNRHMFAKVLLLSGYIPLLPLNAHEVCRLSLSFHMPFPFLWEFHINSSAQVNWSLILIEPRLVWKLAAPY